VEAAEEEVEETQESEEPPQQEDATEAVTNFYDYALNGDDWGALQYADGTVNQCGNVNN